MPPAHYGGTERVIDWLIKELAALGHRLTYLGPAGSSVPAAAELVPPPDPTSSMVSPADFLDRIPTGTDIVHVHCAADLDFGVPTLKTIHGYPFSKPGTRFYGERRNFDQFCSFVSNAQRNLCGRIENPFVHNGIDLSEYRYEERKDDYFLFLAKVDWPEKGLWTAIDVARQRGLKLLIAGDFIDPSFYERELKPHLDAHIRYVGPVGGTEKAELLARARALLFPVAWPEPFGLAVVEALASGTPVLATDYGAMPEIMAPGITGYLCGGAFSVADIAGEMAAQVDRLDLIDPAACRQRVLDLFTSRIMAENYLKLYGRVIEADRRDRESGPAADRLRQRVERDPADLEAWLELTNEELGCGRVGEAIATLNRMLEVNPHCYQGYAYLHRLYLLAGDQGRAGRVAGLLREYRDGIAEVLQNISG